MSDTREQNLRLLSIFNYIVGGMTMFFSLFPIFHLIMGLVMLFTPGFSNTSSGDEVAASVVGILFIVVALLIIIPGEIMGLLMIRSGRKIAQRKSYKFSFAIGCFQCIIMPLGTILGVFTIVLLNSDEYKELYGISSKRVIE